MAHSGADRCLLLSGATSSAVPHHVTRWERHASSPTGWSVVSRIRESEATHARGRHEEATSDAHWRGRLYSRARRRLRAIIGTVTQKAAVHTHPAYKATMGSNTKGAVLIMCVNWGNLDLLMNFLILDLGARQTDRHPEFHRFCGGSQGRESAQGHWRLVFLARCAWIISKRARRIVCARALRRDDVVEIDAVVYLVNALRYDLLFQDADLYWWTRSPGRFRDIATGHRYLLDGRRR